MSFELPDPHRDEDGFIRCWLCSDEGCGLCRDLTPAESKEGEDVAA